MTKDRFERLLILMAGRTIPQESDLIEMGFDRYQMLKYGHPSDMEVSFEAARAITDFLEDQGVKFDNPG